MRPVLAFIIARSTARESVKTAFRLVDWISSHSSSFMRASRLSRVMPALCTRIDTGPKSFWTPSTTATHCAGSRTSRTRPAPRAPSSATERETDSAPFSEVDVPTTVAPALASAARMPSPIPREAPVTSATCPLNTSRPPWGLRLATCGLHGRLQRCEVGDRHALGFGRDALAERGEHLAGRAFHDRACALCEKCRHRLDPAHRMVELFDQRRPNAFRVAVAFHRPVVQDRNPGSGDVDRFETLAKTVGGR